MTYEPDGSDMPEDERDRLIAKFHEGKDMHRVTNSLCIDYDHLERPELEALAAGIRWLTWDPIDDEGDVDDEGRIDFSTGPVADGGVCIEDFNQTTRGYAEELADLCGLKRVDDSTGVLSWGDFS